MSTPVLVGGTTPILRGPSEFLPFDWDDLQSIAPLNRNVSVMTGTTAHDGTFMFQGKFISNPILLNVTTDLSIFSCIRFL